MRKHKITASRIRAKNKKTKELPTKPCLDPFLKVLVYINKNGRTIVKKNGRWQEFRRA